MKSNLLYLATFAAGAAVGAFGAWRCLEAKYEALVDEEIKSIRETLVKKEEEKEETIDESDEDSTQNQEKIDYTNLTSYYSTKDTASLSESKKVDIPYVIQPHDFGEFDDYETITLSYYADKVLADEFDNVVEDVDDMVGYESLRHFGEYEEDVVHVRNDSRKCDYEICRDVRKYSEVAGV